MRKSSYTTFDALAAKLRGFRRTEKLFALVTGLFLFTSCSSVMALLFTGAESIIRLSPTGRTILFSLFCLCTLFLSARFIVLPLIKLIFYPDSPSLNTIALKLGRHYKKVDDRLANAMQLFRKRESNPENYSIALIEAGLADLGHLLRSERFTEKIDRSHLKRAVRWGGLGLAAVLALSILFITALLPAANRLVHFSDDFSDRTDVILTVLPGDVSVLKGEDVSIKAWLSDPSTQSGRLHIENAPESNELFRAVDDTFRYTITNVRDSLRYYLTFQKKRSATFSIRVIEYPVLRKLVLKLIPPRYSKLLPFNLEENVGDVSALKGTTIELTGEMNKAVVTGKVDFDVGRERELEISGNNIKATFRLTREDVYTIRVKDRHGYANEKPIKYHLNPIVDQHPFVRIAFPGRDIDLGEDMTIPLVIEAQDDYGIGGMELAYGLLVEGLGEIDTTEAAVQAVPGFKPGEEQIRAAFSWDLSALEMFPKDVLYYFVRVYDTDRVSGPKHASSAVFRARFPSLYELYQEVAQNQNEAAGSIQAVYEKSRELRKKIDDLSLEMKRTTELDWQQRQDIEEALKNKEMIEKELEELSEKLDDMIERMQENDLVSSETMEKYRELQQLFDDIMTPELKDLMKEINQAVENLDPDLVRKALEEFKLSEEEFQKSLDRSIALMKRLKIEQKLDQAARTVEDLKQRQEKVSQQSPDTKSARDQQRIAEQTEKLKKLLEEMKRDMAEMPGMPKQNIDNALSRMEQANMQEQFNRLEGMMQNMDMSGVQSQSQQVLQVYNDVGEQLRQAQQNMSGAQQRRAMQAMKQSGKYLLELSKQQEAVKNSTSRLSKNSAHSTEMADRQNDLKQGLSRITDSLYEISKENFYIDPQIGQSLGKAQSQMQSSLDALEKRNHNQAGKQQGQAMASLNDAVRSLQRSMQSMMNSAQPGSGMSMEQFMQQMQQLSQRQQGINQQTMGLGPGQQLSLEQQAAMARLAAEQQQVRKSMEELAGEAGKMSDILGSMDRIADDMKEVENDFARKNVDRRTLERQRRILSRMLDSQRSMREREYSREREAETAKEFIAVSPDDLPSNLGERQNRLQQDLLRAKKEGYSRDYLELIRRYFEALSENEDQN